MQAILKSSLWGLVAFGIGGLVFLAAVLLMPTSGGTDRYAPIALILALFASGFVPCVILLVRRAPWKRILSVGAAFGLGFIIAGLLALIPAALAVHGDRPMILGAIGFGIAAAWGSFMGIAVMKIGLSLHGSCAFAIAGATCGAIVLGTELAEADAWQVASALWLLFYCLGGALFGAVAAKRGYDLSRAE